MEVSDRKPIWDSVRTGAQDLVNPWRQRLLALTYILSLCGEVFILLTALGSSIKGNKEGVRSAILKSSGLISILSRHYRNNITGIMLTIPLYFFFKDLVQGESAWAGGCGADSPLSEGLHVGSTEGGVRGTSHRAQHWARSPDVEIMTWAETGSWTFNQPSRPGTCAVPL